MRINIGRYVFAFTIGFNSQSNLFTISIIAHTYLPRYIAKVRDFNNANASTSKGISKEIIYTKNQITSLLPSQ